jgi:hypothetical protein
MPVVPSATNAINLSMILFLSVSRSEVRKSNSGKGLSVPIAGLETVIVESKTGVVGFVPCAAIAILSPVYESGTTTEVSTEGCVTTVTKFERYAFASPHALAA